MRTAIAAAALVLLIAAPVAAETCSQAMLGTTSKPLNWSLYSPGPGGKFTSCKLTIRAYNDVRGSCTSEVSSTARTITAGTMRVTTACALSGSIAAGTYVQGSLVGTFTNSGYPKPRGYGTMTRTKPTSLKTSFTLFRLP